MNCSWPQKHASSQKLCHLSWWQHYSSSLLRTETSEASWTAPLSRKMLLHCVSLTPWGPFSTQHQLDLKVEVRPCTPLLKTQKWFPFCPHSKGPSPCHDLPLTPTSLLSPPTPHTPSAWPHLMPWQPSLPPEGLHCRCSQHLVCSPCSWLSGFFLTFQVLSSVTFSMRPTPPPPSPQVAMLFCFP